MPEQLPLILSQEPFSRLWPVAAMEPGRAVVYAQPDGQLYWLQDRPSRAGQFWVRGSTRYEIDMRVHRDMGFVTDSPLPCSDGVRSFRGALFTHFQVTDPIEVVRHNVQDALPLVHSQVILVLRDVARQFAIEQVEQAMTAMNQCFAQPLVLDQGITIHGCWTVLSSDEPRPDLLAERQKYMLAEIRQSRAIESAEDAIRRASELELLNELLAGGAVAGSFTAAASVIRAMVDATTERQRIAADERKAALHEREETKRTRAQAQNPASPPPQQ